MGEKNKSKIVIASKVVYEKGNSCHNKNQRCDG